MDYYRRFERPRPALFPWARGAEDPAFFPAIFFFPRATILDSGCAALPSPRMILAEGRVLPATCLFAGVKSVVLESLAAALPIIVPAIPPMIAPTGPATRAPKAIPVAPPATFFEMWRFLSGAVVFDEVLFMFEWSFVSRVEIQSAVPWVPLERTCRVGKQGASVGRAFLRAMDWPAESNLPEAKDSSAAPCSSATVQVAGRRACSYRNGG